MCLTVTAVQLRNILKTGEHGLLIGRILQGGGGGHGYDKKDMH